MSVSWLIFPIGGAGPGGVRGPSAGLSRPVWVRGIPRPIGDIPHRGPGGSVRSAVRQSPRCSETAHSDQMVDIPNGGGGPRLLRWGVL